MKAWLAVIALGAGAIGCDRTHMSPHYGKALRGAFTAQVDMSAGARTSGGAHGLEPEEAAIVLDSYRKSLSKEKDSSGGKQAPVLILPPQPGQGQQQPYP